MCKETEIDPKRNRHNLRHLHFADVSRVHTRTDSGIYDSPRFKSLPLVPLRGQSAAGLPVCHLDLCRLYRHLPHSGMIS